MKTRHLVIAVVLFALLAGSATAVLAQGAPLYTRQFGSAQIDYIKKVVTDAKGNVYVAGTTHGAINVPPPLVVNTTQGGADAFVAKFDAQGVLLWVTQFGSEADDFIEGISLHSLYGIPDSLYVVGWTKGSMPGGIEGWINSNAGPKGTSDIFVARILPDSGSIKWIRQYGTPGDDYANGVATDFNAMIYVVGSTNGSFERATELGTTSNAFLMKLSAYGDMRGNVTQFNVSSNPLDTVAYAVAVESPTNYYPYLYVTGRVQGNEEGSLFVARFTSDCALQGSIAVLGGRNKGSDSDTGWAIAVDGSGNVFVAGSTQGTFEGKAWAGGEDIIVVKLTSRLVPQWIHQYGTDSNDVAYGVAADAAGSIYVTGITGYPLGGQGLGGQTHLGRYDIFLTRFAAEDGRKLYTRQIGTADHDWSYGIAIDPSGNLYLAGATEGAMGDPVSGSIDAVLIKYDKDGPAPRPVTEFFINGTVRELPSGSALDSVSVTVKDELGQVVGDYLTDSAGLFASKVTKAGRYFIHKLKIGYRAQADPEEVTVTDEAPSIAPISYMEKIVTKTELTFRKGYNTVRFEKFPAGDRSVNNVFGTYAGNPYVGLIFSFERPMQYLLLHGHKTVGNLKTLEPGRSYMIFTSKAFTIDTTSWVSQDVVPATTLPSTKHRGRVSY